MLLDEHFTSLDLLKMQNRVVDVGFPVSIHDLANRGWGMRVRRKFRTAKTIRVTFTDGKNHISAVIPAVEQWSVAYMMEKLESGCLTSKQRFWGLGAFTDGQLLAELKTRNPAKRRKFHNNVIELRERIERALAA